MEYIMELDLAPLSVLENKKFFLPMTKGLILLSALLLEISRRPSRRKRSRYSF